MNSSKRVRSLLIILCGITFWSSAVIANANEKKASNIIMLWPKDGVSQDTTGMGTPKPDRGDGNPLRKRQRDLPKRTLTRLTQPATNTCTSFPCTQVFS